MPEAPLSNFRAGGNFLAVYSKEDNDAVWTNWHPTSIDLRAARAFIIEHLATNPGTNQHQVRIAYQGRFPRRTVELEQGETLASLDTDHETVRALRAARAFENSWTQLEAEGRILRLELKPTLPTFKITQGNRSRTVNPTSGTNPTPKGFFVSPAIIFEGRSPVGLGDFDVFVGGLGPLRLSGPTERCIREGLAAYQNEQYLSSALLLGAACEGTLFSVGGALSQRSQDIKKATQGRTLEALNRALYDYLLTKKTGIRDKALASRLKSHTDQMIRVRNYGAHPMSTHSDAEVERLLTNEGVGILVVQTHAWMRDWALVLQRLIKGRKVAN